MRSSASGRSSRLQVQTSCPFPPGPAGPKVILCVTASDAHVVANHLIAIHLRDHGYDVVNLGAATPLEELMEAAQANPDALAIVIGSLNGHAVDDLAGLGDYRRIYQVRSKVIVGGNLSVGAVKTDNAADRLLSDGVDVVLQDVSELLPMLAAIADQSALGLQPECRPALAEEFYADACF